ncbi:unnamed protein product [Prunus armeniaca]
MTFPKFRTQSDIDWYMKSDNSGSYEVLYEMEWLVHTKFVLKWSGWCIALFYPLEFTQNSPNDSSHNTMMFSEFRTQSDIDWSMKLGNSRLYKFYPLDFTQNSPNDSSHSITMFPKFWTQSDIDCQNSPNDSSRNIMVFPKFWTQSDIDWFIKSYNSGSYEIRSEMEWLVYCIVLAIGFQSKLTK